MVKAGHPQKACPHPSVCNLCWCFDLMSHWVFRQKLPGMAFLYFPHVLCFISTLYFFLFYFQSLALLCSFPFHSATVIDLYSFCFFFLFAFFLLIYLIHPYFFPWPLLNCQILITPLDSFLYQLSTPLFSCPLPGQATTQILWVFKISTLSSSLSCSVPLLLPHGSISILGLILQKLVFVGNWVTEDCQITLTMEIQSLKYGKLKCVLLNGTCSS